MFTWSVRGRAHPSSVPPIFTAPPSGRALTGIGSIPLSPAGSQMPSSIQPRRHRLLPDAEGQSDLAGANIVVNGTNSASMVSGDPLLFGLPGEVSIPSGSG